MRLAVAALMLGLASAVAAAQPRMPVAPAAALSSLGDEFDGAALAPQWTLFHQAYGWPDKVKSLEIGKAEAGVLTLQPYHSAWVRDLNAPFLFKTVTGDFDVRARVRVRGLNGPVPGGTWSLGGLMARVPNGIKAEGWRPRAENWHFITTGVGHEAGKPMTETKGTYNSYSSLKLRPWNSGWTELRLVRVGMALIALARPDANSPWQVRDRFYRMEGNPAMQVGLIAYTHSIDVPEEREDPERINALVLKDARVDMAMDIDWIRFAPPRPAPVNDWYRQVSGANRLADPNLSEAEILAALGA